MAAETRDAWRDRAMALAADLRATGRPAALAEAKGLLKRLRDETLIEELALLCEAISRCGPLDATSRRMYAQALIETGKATAAIDLLDNLARRLPEGHPELIEATGLTGRAYKQMFFDSGVKDSPAAKQALWRAIAAYAAPYVADPERNTWHGVNLLALLHRARGLGLPTDWMDEKRIARRVLDALGRVPTEISEKDEWHLPTMAEASLGLGDWDAVARAIHAYATPGKAKEFQIRSTLRQFTEVWDLEAGDPKGRAVVNMLRARLLSLQGGELELPPAALNAVTTDPKPSAEHLEAVLGEDGPVTFDWYLTGAKRGASVASVRQEAVRRMGDGVPGPRR